MEEITNSKKLKRKIRNEKLRKARQAQFEKRQGVEMISQFRRITDFELIVKQLEEGCQKCISSPLLLTDSIFGLNSYPNRLVVLCHKCDSENRIAIHSEEVEDKMALSSIHNGIGHSHIEGIFSIIRLPSIAHRSFKDRERKVGTAIEEVAKDSCHKWKLEQKIESELTGTKSLKGCYDMFWRTRSGMYNSSSGSCCIIGYNTGKCIDFATRNKDCRFCSVAAQKGAQPNPHDCRKNFWAPQKQWTVRL